MWRSVNVSGMRRAFVVAVLVLVPCAAWLLWPQADPRFEIRFDPEKTARARRFLEEPAPVAATARPPNVVLIVADDLGKHDTSLYGAGALDTPQMQRLADAGVRFTEGTITSPVCSPSRAALMTGRYPQRFGFELLVHDGSPTNRLEYYAAKWLFSSQHWQATEALRVPPPADVLRQGLPPSELTLAELLRKHGYATAIFGKWHLGNGPQSIPEQRGFQYQYGFYDAFSLYKDPGDDDVVNARGQYFIDQYQWWKGRDGNTAIRRNGIEVDETAYLTDRIADEAIAWIEANRAHPFFAYVPFNAPHAPLQADRRHYERFAHVADPAQRVYLAMISSLDEAIGRILDVLDQHALSNDTLVIFLSDNGGAAYTGVTDNGPLKGGKLTNFEGGLNVPFVVRWPQRLAAAQTYTEPVSSLDLFATIVGAGGVALPDDRPYDGIDLVPYLRGEKAGTPHAALFWRAEGHRAIRAGRYKLISDKRTGARALYDLVVDKGETRNLIDEQAELADELEKSLERWESELVDPAWPPVMEYRFEEDGQRYVFPL